MDLIQNLTQNKEIISYLDKNSIFNKLFSLGTNTSASIVIKLKLIYLICFLCQKMRKKDPVKYNNCLSLLNIIFDKKIELNDTKLTEEDILLVNLAVLCDEFLWGTNDELPPPENYQNLRDIKNAIITYVKEEWLPF